MLKLLFSAFAIVQSAEVLFEGRTKAVVELTDATFQSFVNTTNSKWLVLHYAHWCGHCVSFAPVYISLAETFRSVINFAAIDCATQVNTCIVNDIKSYPTLLIFENGVRLREVPQKDLKKELAGDLVLPVSNLRPKTFTLSAIVSDASLTMRTIIEREVFRGATSEISGTELADFVRLLKICGSLPLNSGTVSGCTALANSIEKKDVLQRVEFVQLVKKYVSDDLDDEYETCKDFSCGMWRLLHLVSLEKNAKMADIRFLVDKYFSCEVCREHFLAHFDACDFGRPCGVIVNDLDVVKWLWRLHNSVNVRLGRPEWGSVSALLQLYGHEEPHTRPSGSLLVLSLGSLIFFALYRFGQLVFPGSLRGIIARITRKYKPITI